MPLRDHMKLISVDDHVIEHPDVWLDRLPARLHDVAPRIIETSDTVVDVTGFTTQRDHAQVWQFEGKLYAQFATQAVAGKPPELWENTPWRFDEIRPGCFDPRERVKDMDIAGIWAQL